MFDTSKLGPMYEDFRVGATLPPLPSITLTEADNAVYRAITGDQHLLAADTTMYRAAASSTGGLANPGLVMQYSIGQTTMATRQAIANLYYRSVRVLRPVEIGQTLSHDDDRSRLEGLGTEGRSVPRQGVARHHARARPTSAPSSSTSVARSSADAGPGQPGHADDIPGPSDPTSARTISPALVPPWDLSGLPHHRLARSDDTRVDPLRDHIDLAAPLARLTFNQAAVHRDHTLDGRRSTARVRRARAGSRPGVADAHAARARHGRRVGRLRPHRPGVRRRPARVPSPTGRQVAVGSGHLTRFEVIGTKLADAVDGDVDPVDILRWTPMVWSP